MTINATTVGRPSELTDELINKAHDYLCGGYEVVGEVIPNIAGLACYLGKSRSRIYVYAEQNEKFKDTLESILALQESRLVNKGLIGEFNPTIAKLMLSNHGYSDKQEVDNTSSDGSMSPQKIVFEVVDNAENTDSEVG